MKKMFKKARIFMIVLAIPYLFVMFLMVYRVDYRISTPGDLTDIGRYIELEADTYAQENPISSIYVMSVPRPTFFQLIVSTLSPSHTQTMISPQQREISDSANFRSGQVARNTSIDASFIASLEALDMEIEYERQQIVRLIYNYTVGDIEIGDIVLSVNGNTNIQEGLNEVECEEEATLEVDRDGEIKTVTVLRQERDGQCVFGISLSTYYNITHAEIPLEARTSLVGGPSGGLMQTLYIYNALSEFDFTSGLKITGTGTINIDGSIGSVGSIREKVFTAHNKNADVFFVPKSGSSNDNYSVAINALEEIPSSSLEIVGVSDFVDALNWLMAYHGEDVDE